MAEWISAADALFFGRGTYGIDSNESTAASGNVCPSWARTLRFPFSPLTKGITRPNALRWSHARRSCRCGVHRVAVSFKLVIRSSNSSMNAERVT